VPLGKAKVVREGEDITIVAWGAMIPPSQNAAESVESGGVFPEVIDLRTLSPWDREAVLQSVKKTGRLLVVHCLDQLSSVPFQLTSSSGLTFGMVGSGVILSRYLASGLFRFGSMLLRRS
jgi:pyruvate dehydrogenase E1 component beta subunit